MGHYWSEMRGEPTAAESASDRANLLAAKLKRLPASNFSVIELEVLMKTAWSEYRRAYHPVEQKVIEEAAKRLGVK